MKLSHEQHEQACVIWVKGDLTSDSAQALRQYGQTRLAEKSRDLVFDLAELDAIDSGGLETLVSLQEACEEQLGQVRLAGCQDVLLKILECTRLLPRFPHHDTVEAAMESL